MTWLAWLIVAAVVGALLYVGYRFSGLILDSTFPAEEEDFSLPDDVQ